MMAASVNSVIFLMFAFAYTLESANIVSGVDWRIVGGTDAPRGAYPYIVSLYYHDRHNCGASILNKNWILTAAHCVEQRNESNFKILAGTNQLNGTGQTYDVLEIHVHEDYDTINIKQDVAVLKVESIAFNENVQPIGLAREVLGDGVKVKLSGWGRLSTHGPIPNDLQQINFLTVGFEKCRDLLQEVNESEICAFSKKGEGACYGDSGGPLVQVDDEGNPVSQVGVVSWGRPCARGYPDVYSRISSFIDWIEAKIESAYTFY